MNNFTNRISNCGLAILEETCMQTIWSKGFGRFDGPKGSLNLKGRDGGG